MNNSMYFKVIQDRRSSLIFNRQTINDFYLFFLSHTKFVFKVIGSFYRVCCSCNLVLLLQLDTRVDVYKSGCVNF